MRDAVAAVKKQSAQITDPSNQVIEPPVEEIIPDPALDVTDSVDRIDQYVIAIACIGVDLGFDLLGRSSSGQ